MNYSTQVEHYARKHYECTLCGSKPGEHCKTVTGVDPGSQAAFSHVNRWNKAYAHLKEQPHLRGHPIYLDKDGEFRYRDNDNLTVKTYRRRDCGSCQKPNRPDDHDACLGELPSVINACCGHGDVSAAYIQWPDETCIRGEEALAKMEELKTKRDQLGGVVE